MAVFGVGSYGTALAEPAAPQSQEPDKRIVQLLDALGVPKAAVATAEQVAQQLREANPSVPPEVWTRYAALVSDRAALLALYAPVYSRHLSEEDVSGLLTFYASPAGVHWREALPRIAAEARQAGQLLAADIARELEDDDTDSKSLSDGAFSSNAHDDLRAADIGTLLRESGALNQARAAMKEMIERLRMQVSANEVPPDFWQTVTRRLTDETTLLRLWTPAYLAHLSAGDAKGIIAFYRTAPGMHYVQAQDAIRKESLDAATLLSNRSARQAVREVLGPLPQWRLQNPPASAPPSPAPAPDR